MILTSPFPHCRPAWRWGRLSASDSPDLWFWRGGPAPARAAGSGSPWEPAAPFAFPRATWLAAPLAWRCVDAAPAPAPASPPAPCRAPTCSPFGKGATKKRKRIELCYLTQMFKLLCSIPEYLAFFLVQLDLNVSQFGPEIFIGSL